MDTTASTQKSTAKIFRPRRLGHANLWVKDLKKSEAFYNATCGLAIEFWEPGLKATFLGTGNTRSCFLCGTHRQHAQLRSKRVLGRTEMVCNPACNSVV